MLSVTEIYFLTILETRSPRSRCWQYWFLLRSFCLTWKWSSYPCVFTESSFYVPLCPNFFFLYDTSHIALGLTLMLPFKFNWFFAILSQNIFTVWGIELQYMNFVENTIQFIISTNVVLYKIILKNPICFTHSTAS